MSPQLNDIFSDSWNKLETGGGQDSPFKNMVVCNYAPEGINAYTVVLREANAQSYNVVFYTDYRSPKVEQLQLKGEVSVVMYSDEEKLQLVIKGDTVIHYQNEISQHYWQKNGYKGRRSYLAEPAPSTIIDEPADGLAPTKNKEFEEHDPAGYDNFAVAIITINYLECLQLNRDGNRRAMFTLNSGNGWEGTWLIP